MRHWDVSAWALFGCWPIEDEVCIAFHNEWGLIKLISGDLGKIISSNL